MKTVLIITDLYPDAASKAEYDMILALSAYADIRILVLGEIDSSLKQTLKDHKISFYDRKPRKKIEPSFVRFTRKILKEEAVNTLYLSSLRGVGNGATAAIGLPVKVISYRGAAHVHWHDPMAYITALHPRIDIVCCLSDFVKKEMTAQMIFVRKRCITVYKGMSEHPFKDITPTDFTKLGIEKETLSLVCASQWRREKGLKYLLHAIPYLKGLPIKLLLMGRGTDGEEAQQLVDRLGIADQVMLLGHREDVYEIIKASDIYIQPSLKEGLGRALIEAMFLGKTILSTRSGGPQELLVEGESAHMVAVKSPEALSEGIQLLASDNQKRKLMAEKALERARKYFSLESYTENIYKLFMDN